MWCIYVCVRLCVYRFCKSASRDDIPQPSFPAAIFNKKTFIKISLLNHIHKRKYKQYFILQHILGFYIG